MVNTRHLEVTIRVHSKRFVALRIINVAVPSLKLRSISSHRSNDWTCSTFKETYVAMFLVTIEVKLCS